MDNNDRNNPRPPQKTNSEKVAEYLEFGSPIRQGMLMQAMGEFAKNIVDNKDKVREAMRHSLVNPDAWIQAAEDWQKLNS